MPTPESPKKSDARKPGHPQSCVGTHLHADTGAKNAQWSGAAFSSAPTTRIAEIKSNFTNWLAVLDATGMDGRIALHVDTLKGIAEIGPGYFLTSGSENAQWLKRFVARTLEFVDRFDASQICDTVGALSKFKPGQLPSYDKAVATMLKRVGAHISDLPLIKLADLSLGLAKLEVRCEELFARIGDRVTSERQDLTHYDVFAFAEAFARTGHHQSGLLPALCEGGAKFLPFVVPGDLIGTAETFGKLHRAANVSREKDPAETSFFTALTQAIVTAEDSLSAAQLAQGLANVSCLLGKKSEILSSLVERTKESVSPKIHTQTDSKPHAIVALANALEHLAGETAQDLLDVIAKLTKKHIEKFAPSDVANISAALVKAKLRSDSILAVLANKTVADIAKFSPPDLVGVLKAFAVLNHQEPDLIRSSAKAMKEPIESARMILLEGAARCPVEEAERRRRGALEAVVTKARQSFDALIKSLSGAASIKECVQSIKGTYKNLESEVVQLDKTPKAIEEPPIQAHASYFCRFAWALAVLKPDLVKNYFQREDIDLPIADNGDWFGLYQALLVAQLLPPNFSNERLSRIVQAHSNNCLPSSFEKAVGKTIRRVLGERQVLLQRSVVLAGVPVDFVLGKRIIECDGVRYHKTQSRTGRRSLGSDVIQDRCFHRLGYQVVHIDSDEWRGAEDKEEFIRKKLAL